MVIRELNALFYYVYNNVVDVMKGRIEMTTIDVSDDCIHVFGHSGYAPEGLDIVCCAISTLTESLDRYLRATENQVESTESDGEYTIYLNELNNAGKSLIGEYNKMIDEIIKDYPRYVRRIEYGKIRKARKICKST